MGADGIFLVGKTTETWKATYDAGNTAMVSFNVTIVATNALPTIDKVTDVTIVEDTHSIEVTLTGISEGDDCEAQKVTVTAEGDNPELIISVTLDYTAGDSTGTITMEVAPQMSGEAEIVVTVEDEEGGISTNTFMVTATDAGGLSVSDTFEVCVDGYPVSIGELGLNKFEVQMYPNPTRGQVNMDISSGVYEVQLSVMDITGKVVLQKQYSASENITFDMSGKVSGMYFVKMNIDGNQIVKKLIVDRK